MFPPHLSIQRLLTHNTVFRPTLCQGDYAKAGALLERCQDIQEKALGPEHPDLAETLSGRARVFQSQVRVFFMSPGSVSWCTVAIAALTSLMGCWSINEDPPEDQAICSVEFLESGCNTTAVVVAICSPFFQVWL